MPKRLRSEDEENFGVLVKNHISDREVNMGVLKVGYIHSFSLLLLLSLLFLLIWGGGQYLRAQGGYLSLLLFFLSFCAFCLWITTIWRVQHRLWNSKRIINFKVLNSSPLMILFPWISFFFISLRLLCPLDTYTRFNWYSKSLCRDHGDPSYLILSSLLVPLKLPT